MNPADRPPTDEGTGLTHRSQYDHGILAEADSPVEPLPLFDRWLADAEAAGQAEFNAMALATVDGTGRPTVRNVLLRGVDDEGRLQFFTNRDSAKGVDLAQDDRVALLFSWLGLRRQIRVEGIAAPLPDEVSDAYFAGRPRASRIGAWASEQSSVLADRSELDARVAEVDRCFDGAEVPRPPNWGGYGVTPTSFEFWQGRPDRLHDRLRYRRSASGSGWIRERLAP